MFKNTYKFIILFSLFTGVAFAQQIDDPDKDKLYVTDLLRLSLYQEKNSKSTVLELLRSGDKLIIEEISGPYSLVTTASGKKGWVKRGFLVAKETNNILLAKEKQNILLLKAEIKKLSNSKRVIDQYEKDMDKLVKKVSVLEKQVTQGEQAVVDANDNLKEVQIKYAQKQNNRGPALVVLWEMTTYYWKILLPFILVLMLICFIASKILTENRIKNKFHGIKVW